MSSNFGQEEEQRMQEEHTRNTAHSKSSESGSQLLNEFRDLILPLNRQHVHVGKVDNINEIHFIVDFGERFKKKKISF